MRQSIQVAALCLGLGAFSGCGNPKKSYESPPYSVLKEHSDYALGHHFEIAGTPKLIGSYKYTVSEGDGYAMTSSTLTRHVYSLEGIFVVTDREIPESCSGVRGTWETVERFDKASEVIPTLSKFALRADSFRTTRTVTEWSQ